jgi:hypothetical protein
MSPVLLSVYITNNSLFEKGLNISSFKNNLIFWNFRFFLPPESKFISQRFLGNLELFEVLDTMANFYIMSLKTTAFDKTVCAKNPTFKKAVL